MRIVGIDHVQLATPGDRRTMLQPSVAICPGRAEIPKPEHAAPRPQIKVYDRRSGDLCCQGGDTFGPA